MSVTVSAQVILGCRLDKIAREETRTSQVTRYDENTGKPCQRDVTEKKVVFGSGPKALEFDGWGELKEFFESGKAVKGLTYADSGGTKNRPDKAVVGVELASCGKYSETPAPLSDRLPAHAPAVRAWLTEVGVDAKDWWTWLVLYVG